MPALSPLLLPLALLATAPSIDPPPVPAGTVLVANQESGDVSIITLPSGEAARVPVGTGPHETAVGPDGRWGVVTIYGNRTSVGRELVVVDLERRAVTQRIDLGQYTRPHGVVVLPGAGRRAVVTSEATGNLVLVDVAAGRVEAAIPTQARGSHMVAVTGDGRRAFTANIPDGSVTEVALDRQAFVRTVPVSRVTEGVAVTPDGREVWVGSNELGTVSVLDTRRGVVTDTLAGFRVPYRLAISPDGRTAIVPDPDANTVTLLDVHSRRVLGQVGDLGSPRGVYFSDDGRHAFVTLGTEGAVAVLDVAARRVVRRVAVGQSPDGVSFGAAK